MESEKVKEIKKALECCKQNEIKDTCAYCNNCPANNWDYKTECNVELFQNSLTLINELESENERLRSENKDYYDRLNNLQTYINNHEEIWKGNINNALKQFAEKLKEKFDEKKHFLVAVSSVHKHIDETLKELQGK